MTTPTHQTVIDAVFAMNAYEHNPDDGSWTTVAGSVGQYFSDLNSDQLGNNAAERLACYDALAKSLAKP